MVDHSTKKWGPITDYGNFYDNNIGWDCGFFGNRPYFLELWSSEGVTAITIFLSSIGIEEYSEKDFEKLFVEDAKIYTIGKNYEGPIPSNYVDGNKNEFFSVSVVVARNSDEPAKIEHILTEPFSTLNELNK